MNKLFVVDFCLKFRKLTLTNIQKRDRRTQNTRSQLNVKGYV